MYKMHEKYKTRLGLWSPYLSSPVVMADWEIKHFWRQYSNSNTFKVCGHCGINFQVNRIMIQIRYVLFSEWTLLLLGPIFSGQTRSISWLLMPWLLASPSHQHHDLDHMQCRYSCLLQVSFSTICDISVSRNDAECKCSFYVFSERFIARVNNHKSHSNPCKY